MGSGVRLRRRFLWYEFCYIAKGWSKLGDGRHILELVANIFGAKHPLHLQQHVRLPAIPALHHSAIDILQWLNPANNPPVPLGAHANLPRQITHPANIIIKIITLPHIDNITGTSWLGVIDVLSKGDDLVYCKGGEFAILDVAENVYLCCGSDG